MASGRGGPALLLAERFGCHVHGVELSPEFHAVALERAAAAGLADRVTFELGDGAQAVHEPESYDAALCLGASFVYGGLADTVDALAPAVRAREDTLRSASLSGGACRCPRTTIDRDEPYTTLEGTVTIFETCGLPVVSVIASSEDDWDRYETLHWKAVETWLAANPGRSRRRRDPRRHEHWKRKYLRHQRELLGWAIFVGWKRS